MTPEDGLPDRTSPIADMLADLAALIPEAFSEGRLDLSELAVLLGSDADGQSTEPRFGLDWPGRTAALRLLRLPGRGALRPVGLNDIDLSQSDHVFISGENLEVLKLMQKAYFAAFKMVYLDPPYNNGYDSVYVDDADDPLGAYLRHVDAWQEGDLRPAGVPSTGSRVHSRWLSMMLPRLFAVRTVLAEDGVVFVSIDDHEAHHLRMLMDDVFGPENFVCTFIWEKRYSPAPDAKDAGYVHENILCYRRSDSFGAAMLPMTDEQKGRYKNPDGDPNGPWKSTDYTCRFTATQRPNLYYPITNPNTKHEVWPKKTRVWACTKEKHEQNVAEGRVWWGEDGTNSVPARKAYLKEVAQGAKAATLLKHDLVGHTDEATKELHEWFPELKVTPKPTRLIRYLMAIAGVQDGDLVLDPFARVGTTAEAVVNANVEDGLGARFVLIELPEPGGADEARTLADYARDRALGRVERAVAGGLAQSVRCFSLDASCFVTPSSTPPSGANEIVEQLRLQATGFKEGRSSADMLFEILLASGYRLDVDIKAIDVGGPTAYSVDEGGLVVCVDRDISPTTVGKLAELAQGRVVCLDAAFGHDDEFRVNTALELRGRGIDLTTV